jgi:hypothetical protein
MFFWEIRAGHPTILLRVLISIIFLDGQNVTFLVKLNHFQILEVVYLDKIYLIQIQKSSKSYFQLRNILNLKTEKCKSVFY